MREVQDSNLRCVRRLVEHRCRARLFIPFGSGFGILPSSTRPTSHVPRCRGIVLICDSNHPSGSSDIDGASHPPSHHAHTHTMWYRLSFPWQCCSRMAGELFHDVNDLLFRCGAGGNRTPAHPKLFVTRLLNLDLWDCACLFPSYRVAHCPAFSAICKTAYSPEPAEKMK